MEILQNYDLSSQNTFRLKSVCDFFVELKSRQDLLDLLESEVFKNNTNLFILGGGSNVILPERFRGLVLSPSFKGISVDARDNNEASVSAAAGEEWSAFIEFCLENGLPGVENLTLIPGRVGAAPIQNIGAYGVEVAEFVESVEVFDFEEGCFRTLQNEDCQFSYRDSIFKRSSGKYLIVNVNFIFDLGRELNTSYRTISDFISKNGLKSESLDRRKLSEIVARIRSERLPDPALVANVGSFFKNPIVDESTFRQLQNAFPEIVHFQSSGDKKAQVKLSAAWLIESCGLKGKKQGNLAVSPDHALVLVNHGGATQEEVLCFADLIKSKVRDKFGVLLEVEPVQVSS